MKRAFTLIELIVVIAIILILAAILFPVFNRPHPGGRRSSCQSNLKQIGLGFIQYTQDAGEKFPPVRLSSSRGWADVVQPYLKSEQLFQCPSAPAGPTSTYSTDYFFNRRLARVSLEKVDSPAQTILSGDGDDNAPTWNAWIQLPTDASANESSPAQRHLGYGNYLFADGHVKAIKPNGISTASPSKSNGPTFAVR